MASIQELLAAHEAMNPGSVTGGVQQQSALGTLADIFEQRRQEQRAAQAQAQEMERLFKIEEFKNNFQRKIAEEKNKFDLDLALAKQGIAPSSENKFTKRRVNDIADDKTQTPLKKGTKILNTEDTQRNYLNQLAEVRAQKILEQQERQQTEDRIAEIDLKIKQQQLESGKLKIEEQEEVRQKATDMVLNKAQQSLDTIDFLKNNSTFFGPFGRVKAEKTPFDTQKVLWESNLDNFKSNLILNLMTELKQASKTGATGFGQLSEKELVILQTGATKLQRGLAPKDAVKILKEMEVPLRKVLGGQQNGVKRSPGGNVVIMEDADGNRAEVEVDRQGNPIRVIREF